MPPWDYEPLTDDDQQMSAQISPQSIADPMSQLPAKVPMTFVIVNGQRVPVPVGDEQGDDFDQEFPQKPTPQPPPPTDRPPVITNPLSVAGSTSSATAKGLGTLLDRSLGRLQGATPSDLVEAAKSFGREIPRAVYEPSIAGLSSPSQELRQRGVEPGFGPSLLMDAALDPQNLFGGEPVTGVGHGAVMAAVALPEAYRALKGITSRLITKVLPQIPEKGWSGERILSKIAGGLASQQELETTGLGAWMKSFGQKPIPRAELSRAFEEQGLPMYERWYGNPPEMESLLNEAHAAKGEMDRISYQLKTPTKAKIERLVVDGGGAVPTQAQLRDALLTTAPTLQNDQTMANHLLPYVEEYAKGYAKHSAAQLKIDALGGMNEENKWGSSYALPGGTNRREFVIGLRNLRGGVPDYQITHGHKYQDPNILAHVRMGDFTTEDGRKVLVIDEAQSDAHAGAKAAHDAAVMHVLENHGEADKYFGQSATVKEKRAWELLKGTSGGPSVVRVADDDEMAAMLEKKGYGTKPPDFEQRNIQSEVVPDLPFKGSDWQRLVLQRVMNYAAENGYDEVAWTTGMQQSERYNKSLRNITKMTMLPDGRIDVFRNNESYAAQRFGPYKSPRAAAHDLGEETARRLDAAPHKEPKYTYSVYGPDYDPYNYGNTGEPIAKREFATQAEAEAQHALDQEQYHPADEPPTPASWWGINYEDQDRVWNKFKEDFDPTGSVRAEAERNADRWVNQRARSKADMRIRTARSRALTDSGYSSLPLYGSDNPSFDWLTAEPKRAPVAGEPQQPTFGERPKALRVEARGYARQSQDAPPATTVRNAIIQKAKAAGINLDPDSLVLGHPVSDKLGLRSGTARYGGYVYDENTSKIRGSALRTADGHPLNLGDQYRVDAIASDAFEGVGRYRDQLKENVLARVQNKWQTYIDKYTDEIRESPEYEHQKNYQFENLQSNAWYTVDEDDKLKMAREMGIEKAFDPPAKELRPKTGEVSDIAPPDLSREVDFRDNPLTINSKGMEQEYDKALPDIANSLGKKFGSHVRKIDIPTHGKGSTKVIQGPLSVEKSVSDYNGTAFSVKAGDEVVKQFRVYGDTPEDIAVAERQAHAALKNLQEDRQVWSIALTPELRESAKQGYPLMSVLPPAVGTYLWLKNGMRVRVTQSHDDGSFDAEPAPVKGARP